jgi:hypothetical protein
MRQRATLCHRDWRSSLAGDALKIAGLYSLYPGDLNQAFLSCLLPTVPI